MASHQSRWADLSTCSSNPSCPERVLGCLGTHSLRSGHPRGTFVTLARRQPEAGPLTPPQPPSLSGAGAGG